MLSFLPVAYSAADASMQATAALAREEVVMFFSTVSARSRQRSHPLMLFSKREHLAGIEPRPDLWSRTVNVGMILSGGSSSLDIPTLRLHK